MRIILSIFLFLHGMAHLVGFLVPWRIVKTDDMPYKTTLFLDKINIGDIGTRIMGIIWLLIAIAFFYAGWITMHRIDYWLTYTLTVTIISLVFYIVAIPDSHIGIYINITLIVLYYLNNYFHWLS